MKNFIFKSTSEDLHKISQKIDWLLREQRYQKSDLFMIKKLLGRNETPEEPTQEYPEEEIDSNASERSD